MTQRLRESACACEREENGKRGGWREREGGWRGIGVSGSGCNEVLALEGRNVV